MNIRDYADYFTQGQNATVDGLYGRILRGNKPEDFLTLTDDPHRKLVMLMGADGLESLLGKSGYNMLIEVGYERDYIKRKVDEGNQFKLIVFEAWNEACTANWHEVIRLSSEIYPDISSKLQEHSMELKTTKFEDIENKAGFDFSEVDKLGDSDERFMTYERYRSSSNSLVDARAFLYFTIRLHELFSGNGYTYTADGCKGFTEYIVPNRAIADISSNILLDIKI